MTRIARVGEALRDRLEAYLLARWFDPDPTRRDAIDRSLSLPAWLLERLTRRRRQRVVRLPRDARPAVVVVGNLVVGGTGKTPLVVEIARQMAARGWRVGLLARGHRAGITTPRLVGPADDPAVHGDEPVLLAELTGRPVACGRRRGDALRLLMSHHPDIDLVLSDDGLQHLGLPRSLELAVFDARGAGNRRLLPAGPLREPLAHLAGMDAVLWRDAAADDEASAPVAAVLASCRPPLPAFAFSVKPIGWRRLDDPLSAAMDLQTFAGIAARARVHAAAGIAHPDRFFAMLETLGVRPTTRRAMSDHAPMRPDSFPAEAGLIVMTGKDAVKLRGVGDPRCWVLQVRAECELALFDWLEEALRGPSTA